MAMTREKAPAPPRPTLTLVYSRRHVSEAFLGGRALDLSPLERDLLGILAWRPGATAPHADLAHVLGVGRAVLNNTVYRLRRKLTNPRWIQSTGNRKASRGESGFGYRLNGVQVERQEAAVLAPSEICDSTVIESTSAGSADLLA